jgi:hypothetical protein
MLKKESSMSERRPITSRRKARAISSALLLLGLAGLFWGFAWWPNIMLVIGLPLALRQFLLGRTYDMIVILLVFVGGYITNAFDLSWEVFLPVIFSIGAIFILFKEFFGPEEITEEEKEAEINQEIEEKK